MPNPNPSGLPIPVPPPSMSGNDPSNGDQQQQQPNGPMGGRKVQPSPSLSAANIKGPGSMPPPSHTPNPSQANRDKIKDEPEGPAGSAKSSPANKAAPPPNATASSTPVPAPSTPAPQQLGGPANVSNTFTASPASILTANNLNHPTPPNAGSRPGSSANQTSANNNTIPNIGAGGLASSAAMNRFSFPSSGLGQDLYGGQSSFNPLSVLDDYDFDRLTKEEPLPLPDTDLDFDKYFMADYLTGNVGLDDDATAAAGGSS